MLLAESKRDQVMGCLLGGVLGDAWGGPWENRAGPIRFTIPASLRLSDDSQLTLATCAAILEKSSADPEWIAAQFLKLFRARGIHGIGASTLKAMRDLDTGVHWALAGATGTYAAGNGAAMRIAPLAFLLDPNKPDERRTIRDVCRITHHHDEAYIGALAVAIAIRSVLSGKWSPEKNFLTNVVGELPDSEVRDRIEVVLRSGMSPAAFAARYGTSGYVADTVPLALCCAEKIAQETLPAVLESAITLGGDTDTIASITGQLAGTVVGLSQFSTYEIDIEESNPGTMEIAAKFADFAVSQNR